MPAGATPFSDGLIGDEQREPPMVRDPEDRNRLLHFFDAKVRLARRARDHADGEAERARAAVKLNVILEMYAPLLIGRRWPFTPPLSPPNQTKE